MSAQKNGYTLIEVIVVLAILAVLAITVFANLGNFKQDQQLQYATTLLQSSLREAQALATTATKCGSQGGASWMIEFKTDQKNIDLKCQALSFTNIQKGINFGEYITVDSIATSLACTPAFPVSATSVSFSSLFGAVTFSDAQSCVASATSLTITLKNIKNGNTKTLTISKGGSINVQ